MRRRETEDSSKGGLSSGVSVTASFRHWVNKFELLNCAELGLTDMLCLLIKAKVYI